MQDSLTTEIIPLKARNDDKNQLFKEEIRPKEFFYKSYDNEVRKFNIQRRTLNVPKRYGGY